MVNKKVILIVAALLFFVGLFLLSAIDIIPLQLIYYYVGVSIVTFIQYARDKQAAKKARWRTSESTLHYLSLLGGWPGAIFAQQVLRHKSSKKSFQRIFWITLCLNVLFLLYILSPYWDSIIDEF